MKKRVLLLALLGLCVMAPVTGGGPGGSPQVDCDDAVNSKVLYDTATGLWSCGVDQGGGASWGFGTIGSAVADVGGDTLNVNDGSTVDFTTSNGPPDSITAEVKANSLTGSYLHFANTDRLMGRTTAGAGAGEEISVDAPLTLAAGVLDYDQTVYDNTLFYSDQDADADFLVDVANWATYSGGIDTDNDGTPEFVCTVGVCNFNPNEDATNDVTFNSSQMYSDTLYLIFAKGLGAGSGSSGAAGSSSCIYRSATPDRLFEDKDCDAQAGSNITPENQFNGHEHFLSNDNEIQLLASDHTLASTTATEVTGLQFSILGNAAAAVRTFDVTYHLLVESSVATTGLTFGVNFTGTATLIQCTREYPSTTVDTAAGPNTGIEDDSHIGGTAGGQIMEYFTTRAETTTAPDMGPSLGVATANEIILETIHCVMVTPAGATSTGDLELWHASETANDTTVVAGSWANLVYVQDFN